MSLLVQAEGEEKSQFHMESAPQLGTYTSSDPEARENQSAINMTFVKMLLLTSAGNFSI